MNDFPNTDPRDDIGRNRSSNPHFASIVDVRLNCLPEVTLHRLHHETGRQ